VSKETSAKCPERQRQRSRWQPRGMQLQALHPPGGFKACPAGSFCPKASVAQPCVAGSYCPPGSLKGDPCNITVSLQGGCRQLACVCGGLSVSCLQPVTLSSNEGAAVDVTMHHPVVAFPLRDHMCKPLMDCRVICCCVSCCSASTGSSR
jgi:hypothetical protein